VGPRNCGLPGEGHPALCLFGQKGGATGRSRGAIASPSSGRCVAVGISGCVWGGGHDVGGHVFTTSSNMIQFSGRRPVCAYSCFPYPTSCGCPMQQALVFLTVRYCQQNPPLCLQSGCSVYPMQLRCWHDFIPMSCLAFIFPVGDRAAFVTQTIEISISCLP